MKVEMAMQQALLVQASMVDLSVPRGQAQLKAVVRRDA
jgi:gamma-glutamyl phosphate reductase